MKTCSYIVVRLNGAPGPKIYFGIKKIKNMSLDYYGSGKLIKEAINIHGKENFKRTIVRYFNTYEEAVEAEHRYLTKVNAATNPRYYNRSNGSCKFRRCMITKGEEYRKTHSKVFLKGKERTENQQLGDKTKYLYRSEKRKQADIIHSQKLKEKHKEMPEWALQQTQLMKTKNPMFSKASRQKLSQTKKGKTKQNDAGRHITSYKLQGNKNCIKGWIRLAKMSEIEFELYLSDSISQHPNVQSQAKTRRQKGIYLLS